MTIIVTVSRDASDDPLHIVEGNRDGEGNLFSDTVIHAIAPGMSRDFTIYRGRELRIYEPN